MDKVNRNIVRAKDALVNINSVLQSQKIKCLLIGGIPVQQYIKGRDSQDIDLVCSVDVSNIILRSFPLSLWNVEDTNKNNDLNPKYSITHKTSRDEIIFGPKILEREPYNFVGDWSIFEIDANHFHYCGVTYDQILIPNPTRLAVTKIISFVERNKSVVKSIQDLQDFSDLSNHTEFDISTFLAVIDSLGRELINKFREKFIQDAPSFEDIVKDSSIYNVSRIFSKLFQLDKKNENKIIAEIQRKVDYKNNFLNLSDIKTQGRAVFLVCGVSSSGKDTLLAGVKEHIYHMDDGVVFNYCKKYTTRGRRGSEGMNSYSQKMEPSGNYTYCKDFDEIKTFNIDFAYTLYNCNYALSVDDLKSYDEDKDSIVCIYGKLENIEQVKKDMLLKYNRIPFSILVKAPREDIAGRINLRNSMAEGEKVERSNEMERQYKFINKKCNAHEDNFDLVIENGNEDALQSNIIALSFFITKSIEFAKNKKKTE